MADAVVRRAEWRDAPRLTELMLEYTVGFYRQPEPRAEALDGLLETLFAGRDGVQLVAEAEGDLVGFATLYFTWSTFTGTRIAIMNDLYVVAAHRGTEVASALFDACLEECRSRGLTEMSWETAPDNHRAQRFYEKVGGRRQDWVVYAIEP